MRKILETMGTAERKKKFHLTKNNLQIQCISHRIPTQFFTNLETAILNFMWKKKQDNKNNYYQFLKKQRKTITTKKKTTLDGGITIPDLKL
jgi:chloramphenicol O-acetyltransferase